MMSAGTNSVTEGPRSGLPESRQRNTIINGDCVHLMRGMDRNSVDFILTDPPYICRYQSRSGQTVLNDDNSAWVRPAFREMYRVLKPDSLCLSFYGWTKTDLFFDAWQAAGFRVVGHVVFNKRYASSSRFLAYHHEQAFLLAKGHPERPETAPADVVDWVYTGNRFHPTQKSIEVLKPFIKAFCPENGVVLDPFCGSGSTLLAAGELGCRFVGIELDRDHWRTARSRLRRFV